MTLLFVSFAQEGDSMRLKGPGYSVAMLLAGTCFVTPALAQDKKVIPPSSQMPAAADGTTQDNGDRAPGDIVVTAQRRAQRLIDVPISISTFTAKDIANRGVTTLSELQASVPGLRIVDIGPGSQRIQLRGISQYLGLPTVGNYIDEFSVNSEGASGSAEIRLLDMDRVEVLRGPQPALYGEGSMGGTIRYVTASPKLDRTSGEFVNEISSVKDGEIGFRTEGVLNLPLVTNEVGLRIAAARETVPGYADATFGKNGNDQDTTVVRGKLLIRPTAALSISLLGLYHKSDQDVKNYSLKNRTTEQIVPSPISQRYALSNLVASYDFGPVTLLSSTGYLDQKSRSVDDSGRFFNQLFGAPLLRTAVTDTRGRFKRFAQEVRLSSNGHGPLQYLVGASYSDAKTSSKIDGNGESLVPGLPASALGVVFNLNSATRSKVWALFGNLNYDITDRLNIGVGGRFFRDRRSVDSVFTLIGFPVPPSIAQASGAFHSFNPRADITFKTSKNGIIYANAAKGFRSGGFNQVVDPTTPATFGPEKLWSYEVGTRQGLMNNRILIEAAVYYNDYKGIQATIIQSGATLAGTRNAGKANGFGSDFTLIAKPRRDLSLSATIGWNDVKYKTLSPDRRPGDPLDQVPRWTWSTSIDYTPQLREGLGLVFHADAGYTRKASIILRNFEPLGLQPVFFSESRVIANARAGINVRNAELYVFANNIFDENKIINPAFGAFFEPIRTRPRTLGFGMRIQY
ncbi:TonB-dependent receptor [Sphingomonas sp. RB1R13]|uniref:TonB-dependent receptor n=1 Tax=Sphingomonas sp. RB1R13 TaxID=3096159 RepID=UPI002FC644DE